MSPASDAEAAGVDRQRRVDAELGAHEGDGAVEPLDRGLGAGAVVLEHLNQPRNALERWGVRGGDLGSVHREVRKLADRVPRVQLPRVRVERAEELVTVRVPGPPVVERDVRERRELGGESQRELGGTLLRLTRARERRDVHHPRRAHGPTSVGS